MGRAAKREGGLLAGLRTYLPSPLRQVFFPNRLLAGFPWLCADLYADIPLTRFLSAFGFLFSLFPF